MRTFFRSNRRFIRCKLSPCTFITVVVLLIYTFKLHNEPIKKKDITTTLFSSSSPTSSSPSISTLSLSSPLTSRSTSTTTTSSTSTSTSSSTSTTTTSSTSTSTSSSTSTTTTSSTSSSTSLSSSISTNRVPQSKHQLKLCQKDFQKSLELLAFNRTLLIYEVEWRSNRQLDILLMVVESVQYPLTFIGDIAPYFNQLYSIQCIHQSNISTGRFRHLNMHEYDRTVIIRCDDLNLDESQNSSFTLQFIELETKTIASLEIDLCSSIVTHVTVGLCHKALFDGILFYLIEQWLHYHIYIGVERFYIYDRTLRYESFLKSYIEQGYVVYIPYPLPKLIQQRERFNWIDQFVGKMHCLMQTRASFDWLGTWDFDEYIMFSTNQSEPAFLPIRQGNGSQTSMFSQYLEKNFIDYSNVIIPAANFIGDGNILAEATRTNETVIIEYYQRRLTTWNDRLKYLVQPKDIDYINIHFAVTMPNKLSYDSSLTSPDRINMTNPQSWIRLNHYPSARYVRDQDFLLLQAGSNGTIYDPLICQIFSELKNLSTNRTAPSRVGVLI